MERSSRYNEGGRGPQNNFPTQRGLHVQTTVFGIGAGNVAQVPVQAGAPGFGIGPSNNGERPGRSGFGIAADNYGEWPVQDGAPEFGIGIRNHGGWLVPARAPGFGFGPGNYVVQLVPCPGFGIGRNNDRWWPVHQRVPEFGIVEGNYGERQMLAEAQGFGIRAGIHAQRQVQCGAPGFGFDGIGANYTRMLVPVARPLLRIAVWLPVHGVVPAMPLYPDLADFADLSEDDEEDEIGEEENEINREEAQNALEEILERVCESIELDELAVEEGGEKSDCAICLYGLDHVADSGNRTLIRLPCSHMFHSHCISKWFHRKLTCPIDRKPVGLP